MAIVYKGDQVIENVPSIKAKALRINLNNQIYGTFAEIGAGQETARAGWGLHDYPATFTGGRGYKPL